MRILMVHPHDIQHHPWTIRIVQFAERLGRRGHAVTLAYIASALPWRAGEARGPAAQLHAATVVPLPRAGSELASTLRRLAQGADLLHFQKANPSTALPSLWAAWRAGVPAHYDWDDHETGLIRLSSAPASLKRLTARFERDLPRLADTVSVSSAALGDLAQARGAAESRLFSAPVGADTDRFHPALSGAAMRARWGIGADRRCVVWAGQLEAADYASRLLACVGTVREAVPEAVFVFVGDGPRLEGLKREAAHRGLDDAVYFAGRVAPGEMPEALAVAAVIVAPLDDDEVGRAKSPLKIAEAMAMGKPIVSCRVGEAVTMLADCGMLVPPDEEAALAQGIRTLLGDPAMAATLGRAARLRAEARYNWEWSVDQLERAYAKAMDRTG